MYFELIHGDLSKLILIKTLQFPCGNTLSPRVFFDNNQAGLRNAKIVKYFGFDVLNLAFK